MLHGGAAQDGPRQGLCQPPVPTLCSHVAEQQGDCARGLKDGVRSCAWAGQAETEAATETEATRQVVAEEERGRESGGGWEE